MFEITVTRFKDRKAARATASHKQALLDHLEASAARNGFDIERNHEMSHTLGCTVGEVLQDGAIVASWEIGEV